MSFSSTIVLYVVLQPAKAASKFYARFLWIHTQFLLTLPLHDSYTYLCRIHKIDSSRDLLW